MRVGCGGLSLCGFSVCYMYMYMVCVPLWCGCFVIRISSYLLDGCYCPLDEVK